MTGKRKGVRQRLQKEVAAINRKIASMNVSTPAKSRGGRRRRGTRGGGIAAAERSNPNPNRGRGSARAIGNGGRIFIQRDEILSTVKTTQGTEETVKVVDLTPTSGLMPFLFRLSSCYQRMRWQRAHITWRPSCGTATNGIISYGVAFAGGQKITSRALVASLTPCNDHPVWQATGTTPLVIPQDMLMTRKWYSIGDADAFDKQFGRFCYGLSHDNDARPQTRGEFWISYAVEMEGTNPA